VTAATEATSTFRRRFFTQKRASRAVGERLRSIAAGCVSVPGSADSAAGSVASSAAGSVVDSVVVSLADIGGSVA